MKITVFGATGGLGSQVVSQGLRRGHHITARGRRSQTLHDLVTIGPATPPGRRP